MKRYRILELDFDTRAVVLSINDFDEWPERSRELWIDAQERTRESLVFEFGTQNAPQKQMDFVELGAKPFSVLAFHNKFLSQVRSAFVVGAYYPALIGACALGERILNHLLLRLRSSYQSTAEFKRIVNKDSFDNWRLPIETLSSWGVFRHDVKDDYYKLQAMRNSAIHFNPETDIRDRALALEAISLLQNIIKEQFSSAGQKEWVIEGTPGESYLKKQAEEIPFVKTIFLPSCKSVSPTHRVESVFPWTMSDKLEVEVEITDDEFARRRAAFLSRT